MKNNKRTKRARAHTDIVSNTLRMMRMNKKWRRDDDDDDDDNDSEHDDAFENEANDRQFFFSN